jgi:integrase
MHPTWLLDCAGRRRSPVTMSGFHQGRPPRNKGLRHPPDPPTVEEIIAVMRAAGDHSDGVRLRGLLVVLWRAGLRISDALALQESDLDRTRGAVVVRRGKGGKRREVGMDRWAWDQLDPWLSSASTTASSSTPPRAARTDDPSDQRTPLPALTRWPGRDDRQEHRIRKRGAPDLAMQTSEHTTEHPDRTIAYRSNHQRLRGLP